MEIVDKERMLSHDREAKRMVFDTNGFLRRKRARGGLDRRGRTAVKDRQMLIGPWPLAARSSNAITLSWLGRSDAASFVQMFALPLTSSSASQSSSFTSTIPVPPRKSLIASQRNVPTARTKLLVSCWKVYTSACTISQRCERLQET